jgi:hypothetical protein
VEVHKSLVVHANASVDQNLIVSGDFGVAGSTSFGGPLTLRGNAVIGGDLSVAGQAQFAQSVHIAGSLAADGLSHVGGVTLNSGDLQGATIELAGATNGPSLTVAGTTRTGVLEITGGDLAEPFLIADSAGVRPGSVMILDDKRPGHLRLSSLAYDRRVAGVVSGAGGIEPGVILYRRDNLAGERQVALAGRVYALADASNAPITPGDLLTTSTIPGRVMKATDYQRARGAVVGKAMSSLQRGSGLVLVLVSMQ